MDPSCHFGLGSSFLSPLKLPITVLAFADLMELYNFRVGSDFKGHLIQPLTWGESPSTASLTDGPLAMASIPVWKGNAALSVGTGYTGGGVKIFKDLSVPQNLSPLSPGYRSPQHFVHFSDHYFVFLLILCFRVCHCDCDLLLANIFSLFSNYHCSWHIVSTKTSVE